MNPEKMPAGGEEKKATDFNEWREDLTRRADEFEANRGRNSSKDPVSELQSTQGVIDREEKRELAESAEKRKFYESAAEVARQFINDISPSLEVRVTEVTVTPSDDSKQEYQTLVLKFEDHSLHIEWNMGLGNPSEEYLKNKFEGVVRKIYRRHLDEIGRKKER